MLITYTNPHPGNYPPEDSHSKFYWKTRALEFEMEEEEEYARYCDYLAELAHQEYHASQLEWLQQTHFE